MRARFATAAVVVLLLAAAASPAFIREPIQPGDTVKGEILAPYTVAEFPLRLALGSNLTMVYGKVGGGSIQPVPLLFTDDYGGGPAGLSLIALGSTTARNANPLGSGKYRIVVVSRGAGVGAFRVATSVKPLMRFAIAGTPTNPASRLTFGTYPGFEATVSIKWKGAAPVTLRDVTGPDGTALTSPREPVTTASSSTQSGFVATDVGDHFVQVDVPAGTVRWTVTVRLAGRLPHGTARDFRTTGLAEQPSLKFPSIGNFPIVAVEDETGGPNECVVSSAGAVPDALFLDGGTGTGGCSRSERDAVIPHRTYLLFCNDGYFAYVENVVRDSTGRITSFDVPRIRTPLGSGSATFSAFTYDFNSRPTGWTELRSFDGSGRTHTLVVSRAEYFQGNGYCKAFRVVHTPPGGPPRTYDYSPFR